MAVRTLTLIFTVILLLRHAPVSAEPATAPRRVTLAATGDLLLHQSVVRSARAADEQGWRRTLDGLCRAIDDDEIGIVNVETPLSESIVPPRTGDHPVLGAPPEVADTLATCGIDVASVANNHAFDQDSAGLHETIEALQRSKILPVGAGSNLEEAHKARMVTHQGLNIAFVAATGPMNQRHRGRGDRLQVARLRDDEAFLSAVRAARAAGADVVVALLHWMWDYRTGPRRYERSLARRLIDAGADVLLGAGPHLLHPVERLPSPRGEAIVAWSLGNLISGMGMRWRPGFRAPPGMHPVSVLPGTRDAVVLHVEVEVAPDGTIGFPSLRASALWNENNWLTFRQTPGGRHDIRVVPLADAPAAVHEVRLPAIRTDLGPAVEVSP